jgi:hypothetical protein
MRSFGFWDIIQCSPLKVNDISQENIAFTFRVKGEAKHEAGNKKSLKMKEKCSSERSVDFQLTTWRYIPEDKTL